MKTRIVIIALITISFGIKAQEYIPKTGGTFTGAIKVQSITSNSTSSFYSNEPQKKNRLTINTNDADHMYLYNYNELNSTFNTINIGGKHSLTSGVTILGDGNVGIGTINPKFKLDLKGDFKLGNGSTYTDLIFKTGNSISGNHGVFEISPKTIPGSGTAQQATYFKNASHSAGKTVHNVLVDGNVGIGTTNPSAKLQVHINGNERAFRIKNDLNNAQFNFWTTEINNNKQLRIDEDTNGNNLATFYQNGNVGIGTTEPFTNLHLHSTNVDTRIALTNNHSGNKASDGFVLINESDSEVHFLNRENAALKFSTYSAERMRIASNGNVGIGTTNPKAKLEIVDNTTNIGNYADGTVQIAGSNNVIGFVGQSNLNPGFNRWGIKLRETKDGDFSIHSYSKKATRFIINSSGDIGIGTINPNNWFGGKLVQLEDSRPTLSLKSSGDLNTIQFTNNKIATNHYGEFHLNHSYNASSPSNSTLGFYSYPGGNILSIKANGKVGIGTTTTGSHKLAVEGSIGAREIKVEAFPNWSDFVFEKEYDLPTLTEVENHIKEKGHLKDIPSAKEVKKDGFFLGEMDAKLLQKIEELTLYTIEQQKEIEELKSLVNKLLESKK